jgi:hypothetical protein
VIFFGSSSLILALIFGFLQVSSRGENDSSKQRAANVL